MVHHSRQRGAVTILTVFIMLMTLGALGVLGLGQVVWEKEEVQRLADLAAKAAASEIDNAPNGFQAARDLAVRNGLDDNTDSITVDCNVRGTNTLLPSNACQQSVLVRVVRNVPAAFLGTEPVVAIAEATVTPFISGIVGTNLLNLSLNGGALPSPINEIFVNVGLAGARGLVNSDLRVDLLDLGVKLGVFSAGGQLDMARLLNTEVTALQLINAALDVSGSDEPLLTTPPGEEANRVEFLLSEILAADSSGDSDFAGASLRLGNLVFASSVAAGTGLPGNGLVVQLGNTLNVQVLEPPQMFVAVKRDNLAQVITTARTEQLRVSTRISGVLNLAVDGGGGEAQIKDIECRLPQSDSGILTNLRSSLLQADLRLPSLPLLGPAVTVRSQVASGTANDVFLEGFPDPTITTAYSFEAGQGVGGLLTGLQTNVAALNNILVVLAANPTLNSALNSLGSGVDEVLEVLGLDTNQVYVQIDNMDCFGTAVLTR
ncbi:MAG TPA: pilus assembly protein TadG-related protein [Limnobacter sp.]|nr:pilus assembly protein TadG-related protein [Limnobacter sp.]